MNRFANITSVALLSLGFSVVVTGCVAASPDDDAAVETAEADQGLNFGLGPTQPGDNSGWVGYPSTLPSTAYPGPFNSGYSTLPSAAYPATPSAAYQPPPFASWPGNWSWTPPGGGYNPLPPGGVGYPSAPGGGSLPVGGVGYQPPCGGYGPYPIAGGCN